MATEILRPNAAGDETSLVADPAVANYLNVDEAVPDEYTTYVYKNANARDLYNVADSGVGAGVINKITVHIYSRRGISGGGTIYELCAIKCGEGAGAPDEVHEGGNETMDYTWTDYSNEWNQNPKTTAAWQWAEIDTLQIGVRIILSGSTGYGHCTQVYVEVDYTVSVDIEVEVPLADTANGATLVPTFALDAKPAVPLASTTNEATLVPTFALDMKPAVPLTDTTNGVGVVPAMSTGTTVTVPLASTTNVADFVPSLGLDMKPTVPLAGTINIVGVVPTMVRDMKPDVPLTSTTNVVGNVPTLLRDMIFAVPLTSTTNVTPLVPTLRIDRIFAVPLADTINIAGLISTFVLDMKPVVPLATTTNVTGKIPTLLRDMIFTVPLTFTTDIAGVVPALRLDVIFTIPIADTINGAVLTPGAFIYSWRRLSATLLSAQQEDTLDPLIKVTLSKSSETDIVLEGDRILRVPAQEESTDSQTANIVCDNSDGYFNDLDLKGWDAIFDWGLVTSIGDEYAHVPPLKVLAQYESSAPGALICRLSFIGIPDRLALDKASADWLGHWADTKTVKDLITEIAGGTAVTAEIAEQQIETDSWLPMNETQTLGGITFTKVHGLGQRLGLSKTITKLAFKLKKTGSPTGTVVFRVRDAESEDVLASVNYSIGSITGAGGWCEATLATPIVVDLPLTFPGGVPTGGLWIYCEHVAGTDSNYISVAYNSVAVKSNEWLMVVGSVLGPTEFSDLDIAYKLYYQDDGVNVFSHCEAYDVVYESEDPIIGTYCPADAFKIKEGTSRLDAINTLLAYTGCAKRIRYQGMINIKVPTTTGSTYDSQYSLASGHTFFSKSVREALVLPNKITVHSFPNDDDQYSGISTSPTSFGLLPVEDFIKTRLASNVQAANLAGARIAQLERNAQRGSARVPMNLGSEILDYVLVTDERQSDTRTGNIGYIRRSWIPGKKWDMQFALGDVAIKGVKGTKPSELIKIKPELVLADEANITLGDLRPILELIADNFVDIWDGGVSEDGADYDGINDLARNQAVLAQSIATIFALLGYGEGEDSIIRVVKEYMLPFLPKYGGTMTGDIKLESNEIVGLTAAVELVVAGDAAAITTGEKGHIQMPFAGTIESAVVIADRSGSIVIDVWKDTYANFPPDNSDSITASAPPTITSSTKSVDTTLTGWTTIFNEGDVLAFNVDSCTDIQRITLILAVKRT